jgi:prolyl-tRNA synthetase
MLRTRRATRGISKDTARATTEALVASGTRAKLDDRENYTPGWKYNHWELKGVPLRVEFGPRDMEAGQCVVVRRDTGAKETVALSEVPVRAAALCEEMQADMLARATKKRNESIVTVTSWDGFIEALDATLLTDEEYAADVSSWRTFENPFANDMQLSPVEETDQ